MGCGPSIYKTNQSIACNRKTYEALGLNEKNINELYEIFKSIDIDDSGLIDILEMMARLQLEITPFSKRVFKIFDADSSGQLDFWEFVISTWNYCTLAKSSFGKSYIVHILVSVYYKCVAYSTLLVFRSIRIRSL
jgi:hypothetical protein